MKLKTHFKPTFPKVILAVLCVCAFFLARFGVVKPHVVRKTINKQVVTAPIVVPPKIAAPQIVKEVPPAPVVVHKIAPVVKKENTKELKLKHLLEANLSLFDGMTDALEIQGPIDELINYGFTEESLSDSEVLFASNKTSPKENEIFVTEGLLKKDNFDEIKKALQAIKEEEKEENKKILSKAKNQPEEKNILVVPNEVSKTLAVNEKVTENNKKVETEIESSSQPAQNNIENEININSKENEADELEEEPTLAAPSKKKLNLSPIEASMGTEWISNSAVVNPSGLTSQTIVATQPAPIHKNIIPPVTPQTDPYIAPSKTDKLNGTLYVDSSLDKWLVTNKGHIQLSLLRYGSRNSEDAIFLSGYKYPERDFDYDTSNLEGKYQLVAEIYSNTARAPFLQIAYPKALSPDNFGEKVSFYLKMKEQPPRDPAPVLNLTVFEAASGNYRQAKPIQSADISIVGLESLGRFRSDKEGNVRITNIPANSELLMDVQANGYYPTRKIVPIIGTSAYGTVSLIEKQKVETVTGFFTRKPQEDKKAVIFGRVYDPASRKPQIEEEVSLSNRNGHALYFNALPDTSLTSSTATGLFAFMNVEPSFRALFRTKSPHALPMQLLPGYGYAPELGRGGSKSIRAVVTDPVQKLVVQGLASTIGNNKGQTETDETGRFEITNVDLPTGNVTVEFRAKDYPVTWYTLPWDTREAVKTKNLYIIEKELIYESAMSFARVRPEKHKGILVGGADPGFFKDNPCMQVELLNHNGKALEEEKGPYLLYQRSSPKDNFCLTKENQGFAYYNLPAGEYILNWKTSNAKVLSSQVVRIGADRLSIVVR